MTNRPKIVRTVFSELLGILGDSFTHSELLESANSIVEVVLPAPEADGPKYSSRTGGLPFDQWAVDAAMRDGGWRVFNREKELVSYLYEDDYDLHLNNTAINDWFMENAA